MDTFKGQDNDTMKELCAVNHCEIVIVPHNLTNKFQPLDISVNKAANSYISIKYNEWFSDQVTSQLLNGRVPTQVKVSTKLRDIKAYACKMDRGSVHYLQSEREMITRGFDSAGITEAVTRANDVMMKVENPFRVVFSNSCTFIPLRYYDVNTLFSQFFENIQFLILSIGHYSQHC